MLESYDTAQVRAAVVWIDVLPSDDAQAAHWASALFDDPRVAQFHDPARRAGATFASTLALESPPAWDVYLLYRGNARWSEPAPEPYDWVHQLASQRATPERLRCGVELAAALHGAMQALGFTPNEPTPPTEAELARGRIEARKAIAAARSADRGGDDRCPRCASRVSLGQCSLAGWRKVTARRASEPGNIELAAGDAPSETPVGRELVFDVDGLACPDCMLLLAAAPLQLDGVQSVVVDYDAARMSVSIEPLATLSAASISAAVEIQGYGARPVNDE